MILFYEDQNLNDLPPNEDELVSDDEEEEAFRLEDVSSDVEVDLEGMDEDEDEEYGHCTEFLVQAIDFHTEHPNSSSRRRQRRSLPLLLQSKSPRSGRVKRNLSLRSLSSPRKSRKS